MTRHTILNRADGPGGTLRCIAVHAGRGTLAVVFDTRTGAGWSSRRVSEPAPAHVIQTATHLMWSQATALLLDFLLESELPPRLAEAVEQAIAEFNAPPSPKWAA